MEAPTRENGTNILTVAWQGWVELHHQYFRQFWATKPVALSAAHWRSSRFSNLT